MAEYILGRIKFVYQGDWVATTPYVVDDVVTVGGKTYICVQKHTASAAFATDSGSKWEIIADGLGWRGDWTQNTLYNTGDLVKYGAIVYQCKTAHTSAATNLGLENDSSKWDQFTAGTRWLGAWTTNTFYHVGDLVKYGGYVYYCATGHTSAATAALGLENDSANWQTFNAGLTYLGNWAPATRYKVNDLVKNGGDTYICVQKHTSGLAIDNTGTYFQPFVEGLQFESSWDSGTDYQIGDLVTYGGYTYVALTDNTNSLPSANPTDWDPFTTGFYYAGDWDNTTYYKISSVVRLNGYTYLSITDSPAYSATATATQAGVSLTITGTTSGTDLITVVSTTGLTVGARVKVESNVGGLDTFQEYFVVGTVNPTTFQLSTTQGGSPVTLTTTTGQSVGLTADAYVVLNSTTNLEAGQSITFASTFGGITGSATYYVLPNFSSNQVRLGLTANSNAISMTNTTSQNISCNIAAQPGNASYWTRLNPGLYWKNSSATYTSQTTTNVTVTNVAASGAEYTVVRNNGDYTITRTANGTNYTTGDVIKIAGTSLGGITPANDVRITVTASGGAITAETYQGSAVTWTPTTNYVLGDVITFGVNSYNCINPHTSTTDNRPDNDTSAVYWNILTAGAEELTLQESGDTLYYGPVGPTRLPIGLPGQVLRSTNGYPMWTTYGQINNIVYVGPNGVDAPAPSYGQTIDLPWKTVRYAAKQVEDGYLRPNAQYLLKTNKQFIMKEVTNYIVYTFSVTVTATNSNNNITCNSTTPLSVGMPIKFTGTLFGGLTAGTTYYVKTIEDSQTFTISDTLGGNVITPTTATGSMTGTLSYDSATCERDVGIIVDALVYDLGHGGNLKSTKSAQSYYTTAGNAYINSNLGSQVIQTIAAYNYLNSLVTDVLGNVVPTYNYQSLNGASSVAYQSVNTSYTSESDASSTATQLIAIITNGLAAGTSAAIQPAINPGTTIFVKTGTYTEVLPIVVAEYVAIVGDELRGTTVQPKPANPMLVNDKPKSAAVLTHIQSLMPALVTNVSVTPTAGNVETQITSKPAGDLGLTTASSEVTTLATTLYDIFNNGLGSVPGSFSYGSFTNYNTSLTNTAYACSGNTTGSTAGYGDGAAQLLQNKQFLKDEISAWLAANEGPTWSALSPAQQTACQRDVGYIVDAIYYDMLYGGNTQTLVSADSYFSYYQLVIQSSEKSATIAAYTRLKDIIDNIVIKNTAGWSKTTASPQVTSGTAGSTNAGTFAQERVQNIIDYLTNGTAPATIDVAVTAASTARQTAYTSIQARRTEIQRDATAWVKKYFQFLNFNEATCYRDVGYIVDAISRDIVTQSNFATCKAGMAYYRALSSLAVVIGAQKSAELGMINFLMYKLKAIASSGAVTLSQVLLQDTIDTINDVQNLGGLDVQTFGTTLYNNALGIANGAEVIRANKEFLAAEASAYVQATYAGTVTSTTASTNLFTCSAAHNFMPGDPVLVTSSIIANSGLTAGVYYIETTPASNTFTLMDATGTTVDVTSNGTGSMPVVYAYDETSCKRDTREYIDALVYDMQYTGNYKLRRAAELYLNAVEGSQRSNMYLVRNGTGLRNQTMTGLAGEIGLPITGLTANGTSVTLTFRGLGTRVAPYWVGQTITVSGVTPIAYNGTYVVTASTKTSVTFASTTTGTMTVAGVIANQYGTKRPTAGAYSSLDPGFGPWDSNVWITTRSCYAQNCTLFGTGNVGMKIDSSLHAGGNKSIVANDYTTLCSDGIGVWCTGSNSLVELVSVFCYYSYSGYLAELGGKMRATNGNSSYGTYGVLSEGVDTYETPIYARLNNQNAEIQIEETLTDGTNEVLRMGFTNAGTGYNNVSYTINGSGYNAVAVGDEFRDGACFETRILDNNDGSGVGQIGGAGYLTVNNVASGGNATTITLAGSDTALSTTYVGMQIQITGGLGVGQVGTIVNLNTGTKLAKIAKSSFTTLTVTATTAGGNNLLTVASTATLYVGMPIYLNTTFGGLTAYTLYYIIAANFSGTQFAVSTSLGGSAVTTTLTSGQSVSLYAAGWDHIIPGRTIQSTLDSTTAYTIEPKITYTAPGYTATSRTLSATATWKAMTFGGGNYLAVANGSTNSSYSTDGKTWASAGALTGTTTQWQGVAFGGGYGATATLTVGGLGGSAALLTATITNGLVTSITVERGGYGYTTPPVIEITGGGGVGCTATAHVLNGSISSVDVTVQGSGYTSAPTVTARTDTTTEFIVSKWGRDYTSVPTVTVSAPFSGTAFATSTAYNSLNAIVYYTNAGVTNWYQVTATGTSASTGGPTHTSGSDVSGTVTFLYIGTTARGTAVLANQGVASITMSTAGVGYTTAPTVTITDSNAKYVAISGTSNATAYQTPTGAVAASAWTAGGNLPSTSWGGVAFGIVTGTPIWLAVGGTSSAATTNDGATWASIAAPTLGAGSYSSVAFGNGKFIAIQTGGTATSIFDGSTWTNGGVLPASANWSSITYGNGRFVAVASGSTNVAYSVDMGATWVAADVLLPSAATWTRVRYGQGLFFAVASGGTAGATSPDGLVWTARTLPASSNWSDIVLGNNNGVPLWAAISNTSGTVAASIKTGATAKARTKVASGSISQVIMVEPGSNYPRGTVTATTTSTNLITVDNTENLIDSQPVEFTGLDSYGLVTNTTYYVIGSTITSTQFKVSATAGSATSVNLTTASGLTGAYRAGPIVTITDSNKTKVAVTRVRMGDGAVGNPSFSNRGTNNSSASSSATGDGYADLYQPSTFINIYGLSAQPTAGANVEFASIANSYFKLVQVLNVLPDTGSRAGLYSATFQINPGLSVLNAPAHYDLVTTRLKYSQVRLTGHDFLYIGTGNAQQTNYPYVNVSTAVQSQQTKATNGGRNFFTSTDQDGNFNVGNLFSVQQATGTATLNATAFNLSGLQSLQLGSVTVGTGSATITQFSADPYFTANSDNILPTQRAIKSYITSQIGGGQSSLNVNTLTSGLIYVANNTITTTTGVQIQVKAKMNFTGGIDGAPVALQFFLLR